MGQVFVSIFVVDELLVVLFVFGIGVDVVMLFQGGVVGYIFVGVILFFLVVLGMQEIVFFIVIDVQVFVVIVLNMLIGGMNYSFDFLVFGVSIVFDLVVVLNVGIVIMVDGEILFDLGLFVVGIDGVFMFVFGDGSFDSVL